MSFVRDDFNHLVAKIKWKLHFRNATSLGKFTCGMANISIGQGTYGPISVLSSDPNPSLRIGSFCSIAQDVTFVIKDDHPLDRVSTYPFKVMALGEGALEAVGEGSIVVEDDVWVGYRATILDGVTIHRGGVVAAGAVVTKDVPPYTIVGGVPAKPIKKRFSDSLIEQLMRLDFDAFDAEFIREHLCDLYSPTCLSSIEGLLADAGERHEL